MKRLFVILFVCIFCSLCFAQFDGSGTASDPYLIYTAEQLNTIGQSTNWLDKHFRLMADIDISSYTDTSFNRIGTSYSSAFTGVFDGNGHAVLNFTWTSDTFIDYIGLFGYIKNGAVIKDLGLVNANIQTGISNHIGGLVGRIYLSDILNCYVTGQISAYRYVGGLVGTANGNISGCYSNASVAGYEEVGSLVGDCSGTVSNCYSKGSVEGSNYIGGFIGDGNASTITNCYSAAQVEGGFIGYNSGAVINNCFWDNQLAGPDNGAGTGLSTAQMQTLSTYNAAGWDFVNTWKFFGGDYPRLIWEQVPYGSLQVTIEPSDVVSEGAKWRRSGTITWHNAGNTEDCIPSDYSIEFKDVNDWVKPETIQATVNADEITEINAVYTLPLGSKRNPHKIATLADFDNFVADNSYWADDVYVKLESDIDLTSRAYTTAIIAPDTDNTNESSFDGIAYKGNFDGAGFRIINLTVDNSGANNDYLGLFGQLDPNAVVTNLELENVSINSNTGSQATAFIGSVCGENLGTITNCKVTGNITGVYSGYIGGLAGQNTAGTIGNCDTNVIVTAGDYSGFAGGITGVNLHGIISNSSANGSVTGGYDTNLLGGLVGINIVMEVDQFSEIYNCHTAGNVTGGADSDYVGGLVGKNDGSGASVQNCYSEAVVEAGSNSNALGGICGGSYDAVIIDCYATGTVDGANYLGGICGYNSDAGILKCYSTGSVQGVNYIGGICGRHVGSSAIIADTFWDTESSGNSIGYTLSSTTPGAVSNVLGKATTEMQDINTYLNAAWDFVDESDNWIEDNWRMPYQTGYPILSWQHDIPGDIVGSYGVNIVDFAAFANSWMSQPVDSNYNPDCNLDNLGASENIIDISDLIILCQNWLEGI